MIGNINLNLLNDITNNNFSSSNQNSEFDVLLNELFKLLLENKDFSTDSNLIVLPFSIPPNFVQNTDLMQNIKFLSEITGQNDGSNVKAEVLKLFQSGQINSSEQINSEDLTRLFSKIQSFQGSEDKVKAFFNNFVNKNNNNADFLSSISKVENKEEPVQNQEVNINDIFKKVMLQTKELPQSESIQKNNVVNFIKEEIKNFAKQPLKNIDENFDKSSLQANLASNHSNNIQQTPDKIELPVTHLKDISDILFKAVSASQKSITVQLEPPELGRILIKLSMDSSGIKADMKVDYPHIKEMITGLIPEIKSSLQSSGVKVSDFLLDLMRDSQGYSDSYNGQGQKRYKGNQKFFEYFA